MIELKSEEKTPLYEQLYAALADEIRSGQRAPGTALPGRRTMAAQLGVSIHTVDAAYQMLAAEGLAEARPPQRLLCAEDLRHAAQPWGPACCPAPAGTGGDGSGPAVRSVHRQRGHRPVPRPELGAHPAGAALPAAGAAAAWRDAGRRNPAGGDCPVSFRLSRGGMHPRADRGGRRHRVSAGVSGPSVCRRPGGGGKPRLLPHPGRTAEQRPALYAGGHRRRGSVCPGAGGQRRQPVLPDAQPPLPHRRDDAGPPSGPDSGLGCRPAGAVHPGRRLRLGVPLRHPAAAQPAGHGRPRRAGGLPDHLLQEPGPRHPHRLHGAAPQPAGPVPAGFCGLCQHGRPLRAADAGSLHGGGVFHPPSGPDASGLQAPHGSLCRGAAPGIAGGSRWAACTAGCTFF